MVVVMKLTKELAHFIGFWKMRSIKEGIGVVGSSEAQQQFIVEALKLKLITPERVLLKEGVVLFHHIKYKNFFLNVVKNQNDIFARKNKLTAAYVKGMYDSEGLYEKGVLIIHKSTFQDQMLIERLGFYTQRKKGELGIINPRLFFEFLRKYE